MKNPRYSTLSSQLRWERRAALLRIGIKYTIEGAGYVLGAISFILAFWASFWMMYIVNPSLFPIV